MYKKLLTEVLARLDEGQIMEIIEELGKNSSLGKELCGILKEDGRFLTDTPMTMEEIKDILNKELDAAKKQRREFFEELIYFVDRAQKTDAQVYNAIGMNRTLWYRLRDNKNARTNKRNVLKMAIILHLDYWEMYYLLNLAGYSLMPAQDPTDKIVSYCIRSKIYDCKQIDELFFELGEEPLFSE
ncbi:MAG: hypothetical protein HFH35_04510 [Eubacterium sp.]|nr:hypothetical protein [Eubacterium sp.]